PNNPRIYDEASEKLAEGIEKFGFINPIIINHQNELLAGHTRIKAMQKLGKTTIPAIFVDMNEADAKGFSIYDNKSAEFAEWDEDLLKIELEALKDLDFNIDMLGFDFDIDDILDGEDFSEKNKDIKEEEIRPYEFYHILMSIPFSKVAEYNDKINDFIETLEGVEVEKGQN
ncbi:MAG: ParB N-terminal domain-containing protein, partial [Sulfurovum sp.]|nr:ParB N-terminal domain-containing protein [Sulfurovaceae bacterium]